jgi:hypothetical protein
MSQHFNKINEINKRKIYLCTISPRRKSSRNRSHFLRHFELGKKSTKNNSKNISETLFKILVASFCKPPVNLKITSETFFYSYGLRKFLLDDFLKAESNSEEGFRKDFQ